MPGGVHDFLGEGSFDETITDELDRVWRQILDNLTEVILIITEGPNAALVTHVCDRQ